MTPEWAASVIKEWQRQKQEFMDRYLNKAATNKAAQLGTLAPTPEAQALWNWRMEKAGLEPADVIRKR